MEFNLTVTISVIIALVALVSPIAVAILNNRYQARLRKMELQHDLEVKQMDLYYSEKKQAFYDLLKIAGVYRIDPDRPNLERLQSAAYSAILFCNQENKAKLQSFVKLANEQFGQPISIDERMKYCEDLFSLSSALNDELIKLKNSHKTNEKIK